MQATEKEFPNLLLNFILLTTLFLLSGKELSAESDCCKEIDSCREASAPLSAAWLSARYATRSYAFDSTGYGELAAYLSLPGRGLLYPYVAVRGSVTSEGDTGCGADLGLRIPYSDCALVGASLSFDHLDDHKTSSSQFFGAAIEYLTSCFRSSLSAFTPLSDHLYCGKERHYSYCGGYSATKQTRSRPMRGAELSCSFRLAKIACTTLWLGGGAYCLKARNLASFGGGYAELLVEAQPWTVQLRAIGDQKRHLAGSAEIAFSCSVDSICKLWHRLYTGCCTTHPRSHSSCRETLIDRDRPPLNHTRPAIYRNCHWQWNW